MTEKLKSLHACWNLTTGQDLNYRATERIWYELAMMDFTDGDLLAVLKHVLSFNKTHPNCPMKVQAHKICGDTTVFGSICAEAKAKARNAIPKPTPKEITLHAFRGGMVEVPNGKTRHVSEVFAEMRKATS